MSFYRRTHCEFSPTHPLLVVTIKQSHRPTPAVLPAVLLLSPPPPPRPTVMGGAFQKKLMGQNGLLSGYSAILRYTNKNLCAEMSAKVTVTHCEGQTPLLSSQKPVPKSDKSWCGKAQGWCGSQPVICIGHSTRAYRL